jgi:hypothetical protein
MPTGAPIASAAKHRDASPRHRHPCALRTYRGDRPGHAAGDELTFSETSHQTPCDHDGKTGCRRKTLGSSDQIEQATQGGEGSALQRRPLAAVMAGHVTGIATGQYGGEELNPDHEPHGEVAKA